MTGFAYHPAGSVAEAVSLLGQYGEDAQMLAGGTSLMLLNRLGFLDVEHVIGLHGIAELRGITREASGATSIGALTTLREIERAPETVPALAEAVRQVATVRIRNQATLGGNLAHADPAQDPPPMLMALGATAHVAGPGGEREIPVSELFTGYLETALEPDELLVRVSIPAPHPTARAGYLKFLPRTKDDFATVSVAALADVADGRVGDVRIALGSVASTPVRAVRVEDAVRGAVAGEADLAAAAEAVRTDISPATDARGSAAYKADMAVVCVRRLLGRLLHGRSEAR